LSPSVENQTANGVRKNSTTQSKNNGMSTGRFGSGSETEQGRDCLLVMGALAVCIAYRVIQKLSRQDHEHPSSV